MSSPDWVKPPKSAVVWGLYEGFGMLRATGYRRHDLIRDAADYRPFDAFGMTKDWTEDRWLWWRHEGWPHFARKYGFRIRRVRVEPIDV